MFRKIIAFSLAAGTLAVAAGMSAPQQNMNRLRGDVRIDGSSTVYPITEAVAESFAKAAPRVNLTVGISGTGGGFKRFVKGEIDISDASRPIKAKEAKAASEAEISFIEVPVAYDGLSIVVNKENDWVDSLTVAELKSIFLDDSTVKTWQDVRSNWPATPVKLFSPGTDSGTFDYFKEVVAGKTGSIRSDMSVSEDDNVLVRGVVGNKGGLAFFGCAYYFENADKLRVVPIVNPTTTSAVEPTKKTIEDGSYAPFSRPLFIYVNSESMKKRHVKAFVEYYLKEAGDMAEKVGYVRLPQVVYDRAAANVKQGRTGTQYIDENGEKVHGSVTDVYK